MDALALAVGRAVLQYLVDKADLIENVRGWLKRDPASLAYQRALLRAYAAFARSDPALAKSFFDQTFLAHRAVPELAKQLTRHEHANGAELARLWAASLYPDALAEKRAQYATDARVMTACANFLQWLDNELKREDAFRDLYDSRALESLDAKFDELVRVLTAQRDEALKRARAYELAEDGISSHGGIEISGSANVTVYGDLVAGDKNVHSYFYGNFVSLDDYYISPDSVFHRVKLDEFVGREWLAGRIDAFLNDASRTSGVFRLEGEAGVGKTSFLAHLVRERGYLHLFAEQVPGDNNVERALLSLGSQIVSCYRLDPYADQNTLPAIAGGTDFLYKLLNMASQRLTAGEKIVVVCDALDEAGNGTNGNVFGLPTTLPDNVYFIVSQRPVTVRLDVKCDLHHERLKPGDANNLHDMQEYLRGMAQRPQIAQQLRARNYSEDEFVRVLTDKSGGVWIYLKYVLDEIQRGSRHPLELDELPNGLVGYYLAYWGDWRAGRNQRGKGESEWYALYLPLLTTLAVAQEPILLDTLIAWAAVSATQYQVRNLLREQWRAFITEREEQGHTARFILYHASLRDFLMAKVDTNALSSADTNFIDELRDGTRAAHQRIIANFTERCRGKWTDLIHDDYARRYLCLHLEGAEQYDKLAALVAWSDVWAKARYDKEESWSGYLNDLVRVWAFAEEEDNVGWQIRCTLIKSTIHSLASNISPELLVQLIETKMWSPARGLAHIRLMPWDPEKSKAFEKLLAFLPEGLISEALSIVDEMYSGGEKMEGLVALATYLPHELMDKALMVAHKIQNGEARVIALVALAASLSTSERQSLLAEALTTVRGIHDESSKAFSLGALTPHLSDDLIAEAFIIAQDMHDEFWKVFASSAILAYLPSEKQNEVFALILKVVGELENYFDRVRILSTLAQTMPHERDRILRHVLLIAPRIKDEINGAMLLADLMKIMPRELRDNALEIAHALPDSFSRLTALTGIADTLPYDEKKNVLKEALAIAKSSRNEHAFLQALSHLANGCPEKLLDEVLSHVREIPSEYSKALLLATLANNFSNEKKQQILHEALSIAKRIPQLWEKRTALCKIAENLEAQNKRDIVNSVLALTNEIQDNYSIANALTVLMDEVSPNQQPALREKVIKEAAEIWNESHKVTILCTIAEKLPPDEEKVVLDNALAVSRGIQDETARAFALGKLASKLRLETRQSVLKETLIISHRIPNPGSRYNVLRLLLPMLTDSERTDALTELLGLARTVPSGMVLDEGWKASKLGELAESFAPEERRKLIDEALTAAQVIQNKLRKSQVLCKLAAQLPNEERQEILSEALAAAQEIDDDMAVVEGWKAKELIRLARNLPSESQQNVRAEAKSLLMNVQDELRKASILSELLPDVPYEEQVDLLPELLEMASKSISVQSHERANLLNVIALHWRNLEFVRIERRSWKKSLHSLARHLRPEFLNYLTELFPVIRHLGGQRAVDEMSFALRDVTRWWP